MKRLLFIALSFIFLAAPQAFALSINTYNLADGGDLVILEDFESYDVQPYDSLSTAVGTFTATGAAGQGDSSYDTSNPKFGIEDSVPYHGRENQTEGGSQWLDSGDMSELTLTVNPFLASNLSSLYFYLQDPSDVGATTTVDGNNNTASIDFSGKPDGSLFLVGITWDSSETLSTVKWTTTTTGDGYGLDDFSTAPVPEPATMVLMGLGLLGIAGISRRKMMK